MPVAPLAVQIMVVSGAERLMENDDLEVAMAQSQQDLFEGNYRASAQSSVVTGAMRFGQMKR